MTQKTRLASGSYVKLGVSGGSDYSHRVLGNQPNAEVNAHAAF